MKHIIFILLATYITMHSSALSAAGLNNIDQGNLISAIEDYRFSDYESAIPTLESLYHKSPNSLLTMQYLALSYQETEQAGKAATTFEAWLKANQYDTSSASRFAWLGLTNAYLGMGELTKAETTLSTWVKANPKDIQAQITLGDILVKQQAYVKANVLWDSILKHPDAKASDQAAAWYYKAWIAYNNQEIEKTKTFAKKSLAADKEGVYANAAKQLEASPAQQQLGFFWRPEEVSLQKDRNDYAQLSESQKFIFTSNLKYQTMLDSVQGRGPCIAFLPFVSLPELEGAIVAWDFMETIHSRSYTYIIKRFC